MPTPQLEFAAQLRAHAHVLIFRVIDSVHNKALVLRAIARIPALVEQVAAIEPASGLVCVVGFGSDFWDVISPGKRPAALAPFKARRAGDRVAPATGGDLMLHIISDRADLNFELALQIRACLGGLAEVMEEARSLNYLDGRDLTGFIDGTENPQGAERPSVALVGDEDPDFAAGAHIFVQRYIHDLARWRSLPIGEQEKVIGRRKADSAELAAEEKPPTAHISRVSIEEGGAELKIVRCSFPYGTTSEAGLFFIAYARNPGIPEKMLDRMIGSGAAAPHDRLLEFTRPVAGATFFAPSIENLRSLTSAA